MLIKVIFIIIGAIFVIFGAVYGFVQYRLNAPVNYEGTYRGYMSCVIGVLFIVLGVWFMPDMYQDALKERKLNEERSQYTYVCDGSTIEYEGFNKLKYNEFEYDLTYDDTNKTATLTKVQDTEQSAILLCCSSLLLATSSLLLATSTILRKATSGIEKQKENWLPDFSKEPK